MPAEDALLQQIKNKSVYHKYVYTTAGTSWWYNTYSQKVLFTFTLLGSGGLGGNGGAFCGGTAGKSGQLQIGTDTVISSSSIKIVIGSTAVIQYDNISGTMTQTASVGNPGVSNSYFGSAIGENASATPFSGGPTGGQPTIDGESGIQYGYGAGGGGGGQSGDGGQTGGHGGSGGPALVILETWEPY